MLKKIRVIVAQDCKRCKALKNKFEQFIKKHDLDIEIQEMMFDSEEAIDLAVMFGLDRVPSFVAASKPFNADDFEEEDLLKVFKKK